MMVLRIAIASLVMGVLAFGVGGAALADEPPLVAAEVIADRDAAVAGETVTVGVVLTMRPGWHIYWRNPGGSGAATEINFSVPKGIEVGQINWPLPTRYENNVGVVDFGYSGTVMLTRKVTLPADLGDAEQIAIDIDANWLVCEAQCIPGETQLSLVLPVRPSASPVETERFAAQRELLPVALGDVADRVRIEAVGGIDKQTNSGNWTLTIDWLGQPPRHVGWFPDADDALLPAKPQITTESGQTRIVQPATLLAGINPQATTLVMLVAWEEADGRRIGVHVPVPVFAVSQ